MRDGRLDGPEWYVQTGGRVYGPYPQARVTLFAQEGRVTPDTLVSRDPHAAFAPAARQPELAELFGPPPRMALSRRPGSMLEPASEARGEAAPLRALLVFAALQTLPAIRFEEALAVHGGFQPIAHGLWLVRARLGPAALRNALSRRLRGPDLLLVAQADPEAAAWFNLDPQAERALRRLWAE